MANDYVVDILLRARDEASARIANLKREIAGLKAESSASDVSSSLGNIADEADRAATAHDGLTKQHDRARSSSQQTASQLDREAQSHKKTSQSIEEHAASVRKLTTSNDDANDSQARLAKRGDELLNSVSRLNAEIRNQRVLTTQQSLDAKRLQQDLASLSKAYPALSDGARQYAGEAEKLGQVLATNQGRVKQDIAASNQQVEALNRLSKAHQAEAAEIVKAKQAEVTARAKAEAAQKAEVQRQQDLLQSLKSLDHAAQTHTATNKELEVGYKDLASKLRSVWKELDTGSAEAQKFGRAMEDAAKKADNTDLARSSSGFSQFAQNLAHATDQIGIKVISLSAALRGIKLVSLVGLIQPLDTALVSLAGGLFNVAAGATQAGAAIGGAFVSGLGQLIPVISVAVAALERVKAVFQAVQAAQQARQEAFTQPNQGLITQLQNNNQLIASEQNLKNSYVALADAQVQVKETQIALTRARIDAVRNLQDLVMAEKNAELQAAGAQLSLQQSRQQLQQTILSGGTGLALTSSQLQVQQSELGVSQANQALPRARQDLQIATRQGVGSGNPSIIAAEQSARQARQGVIQAQQQVGAAQRTIRINQLQAAQPQTQLGATQSRLQFLLSQMSGTEKQLFAIFENIDKQLRSPNGPLKRITDSILQPFIYAGQRLETLLGDPKFLAPIGKLADAMGKAGDKIMHTIFGQRGTSFFETMAKDATQSVPIITRSLTGFMKVFEDIATAAAPAFKRLSQDWANFWEALDRRERTPQGQQRLEDFFNKGMEWAHDFGQLAKAVGELFLALGRDAAPQGMKTVTSFTDSIKAATQWVTTHGPEVTNFFSQARQGLSLIGGVLFNLGKAMIQVFSLTSLSAFSGLLNSVVIPAARDFANVVGFVVTQFMKLINAFGPAKVLLEGIVAGFLGLLALNRVIGLVTKATTVISGLTDATKAFKAESGFSRVTAAWDALTTRIGKGKTALKEAKVAQEELAAASEKSAATQVAASGEVDAAMATQVAAEREAAGQMVLPGLGAGAGVAEGTGVGLLGRAGLGATGLAAGVGGAAILAGGPEALLGYLLDKFGPQDAKKQAFTGQQILTGTSPRGVAGFTGAGSGVADFLASIQTSQITANNLGASGNASGISTYLSKFIPSAEQVDRLHSSTKSLKDLRDRAKALADLPDITSNMRTSLHNLINQLDPTNIAIKKAGDLWGSTFDGINTTTGNVMTQVRSILKQDIQNISDNLGAGTTKGAAAMAGTITSAYRVVLENTSKTGKGVQQGLQAIARMLNNALKAVGAVGAGQQISLQDFSGLASNVQAGLLGGGANGGSLLTAGGVFSTHATGGYEKARPGGKIIQVAEGGYPEVVLTTDPKYTARQRGLLSEYLRAAPHVVGGRYAQGGMVTAAQANAATGAGGSSYVSPFPKGTPINWERQDAGKDMTVPPGTPVLAIGDGSITGISPNWYLGQPLIEQSLANGPEAGKFVYYAEGLTSRVGAGQGVRAGQVIAVTTSQPTGLEFGWGGGGTSTLRSVVAGRGDSAGPWSSSYEAFIRSLVAGHTIAVAGIPGGSGSGATGASAPPWHNIKAPKWSGPGGALGAIGQAALKKVTAAANRFGQSKSAASGGTSAGGSGPINIGGHPDQRGWANSLLTALGIKPNATSIGDIVAWELQEGGNWNNAAHFNPLNTTQSEPGATSMNSVGVKAYTSWSEGLRATVSTLRNGMYGGILSALQAGANLASFKGAVNSSPWGTVFARGGWTGPNYAQGGIITGPVSTFGPPGEAAGGTAYGGNDAAPGIAVNPDGGGAWNDANALSYAHKWAKVITQGHSAMLQVIDKGPSAIGRRGPRKIDITGAGVAKLGIPYGSFQTDAIGTADFSGGSAASSSGASGAGSSSSTSSSSSSSVPSFTPSKTEQKLFDFADQYLESITGIRGHARGGFAGPVKNGLPLVPAAAGFNGIVDRPTMFLAGEGGSPEHVGITPMAYGGWTGIPGDSSSMSPWGVKFSGGDPLNGPEAVQTIGSIGQVLNLITQSLKSLKPVSVKSSDFSAKYSGFVDNLLTQDTGLFDRLSAGFDVLQNMIQAAEVVGGRVASIGMPASMRKNLQGLFGVGSPFSANKQGVVTQNLTAEANALNVVKGLRGERTYLLGERNSVSTVLTDVTKRMNEVQGLAKNDPQKYSKVLQSLVTEHNNLIKRTQSLTGAIAQNVTDIYNAQASIIQGRISVVADTLGVTQDNLQTQAQRQQTLGSAPSASLADRQIANAKAQIAKLSPMLALAKKEGNRDLSAQIQQQLNQLQSSITDLTANFLQSRLQFVEQQFQTQQSGITSSQSSLQTLGRFDALPAIDQIIVDTTKSHIAALQQLLATAQSEGNVGLSSQLQQEIAQLQASVVQASAQMIQDAIANIQQTAQTQGARVSMLQTISQTMTQNASTPAQFAAAGSLNLQALNENETSLQGQVSGYNTLLGQAINQGNAGAVATLTQTIDQLTAQLVQNENAISDNTAQVVQQTSQFTQARGQFQTGIYGGLSQIIQTIGQTTGFTDVASLKALASASNTSLLGTQGALIGQLGQLGGGATGLASLLGSASTPAQFISALSGANIPGIESGQDQTWINTFEGLISNLEQNTQAVAQNNQQLATLNGQLLQPQQWSTTAWSAFRSAIFSGMGNLLPQFQATLPSGSAPTIAPVFGSVGPATVMPTVGTLNINHAPASHLEPALIGEQLAHELSGAL